MIKTKRFCDPREPDDGYRLLVTRYRPRGIAKADETWDGWLPQLGPSQALHAAFWGKSGPAISFEEYASRYLREMQAQTFLLEGLARKASEGTVTLLCSSACTDESRCHRTLLRSLLEARQPSAPPPSSATGVVRRRPPR